MTGEKKCKIEEWLAQLLQDAHYMKISIGGCQTKNIEACRWILREVIAQFGNCFNLLLFNLLLI